MKKLSVRKMADTIIAKRKAKKVTQAQLAEMTGINRGMISRLESCNYTPSIDQLQSIAEALDFEVVDLFEDEKADKKKFLVDRKYNIAVAGTGYVGLSIATLLSQHNHVTAVDIIPEKVELINNRKSPIQDDYIEMYLAEKDAFHIQCFPDCAHAPHTESEYQDQCQQAAAQSDQMPVPYFQNNQDKHGQEYDQC